MVQSLAVVLINDVLVEIVGNRTDIKVRRVNGECIRPNEAERSS